MYVILLHVSQSVIADCDTYTGSYEGKQEKDYKNKRRKLVSLLQNYNNVKITRVKYKYKFFTIVF